jgi:calcineurin-like phosphoesterase family protein
LITWFTSDTHFGHANIIEYCGRPFADVDEMNRVMVERWNARVRPGDRVYHLGDFAFGPFENIGKFLALLNGDIVLVRGNHDRSEKRMREAGFASVTSASVVWVNGSALFLSHKPVADLPAETTDFHLHGHVHEKYARRGNQINVGVDVRGFAPATLDELLATPESLIPQAS